MPATLKFSDFILDSRRFELRRGERQLKLEKIPMELLILLAERGGDLVRRDEIVEKLWGKDVFIEADRSINTAVSKLRIALRDDPECPRFIQTVVGKGDRFIASISRAQTPQTLAVLPFKPLSNGHSDEYLELGMADASDHQAEPVRATHRSPHERDPKVHRCGAAIPWRPVVLCKSMQC